MFGTAPPGTARLTLDDRPVRLAGDGRFVIGFGRDAVAGEVRAELNDGREVVRTIAVRPRAWNIESIPGLRRPSGGPSPEYEAIRAPELARIAAARAGSTNETGWTQAFAWPAKGRISGVYGSQRILGGVPGSPHAGLDIAAPSGSPVLSPADGVVRLANDRMSLEGNLVMVDHGFGLTSSFLHLSRNDVVVGERVTRGQQIGAIGTTGRSTGPHLHWALSWGDVKVDPGLLVGAPTAPEPWDMPASERVHG
ncbi:M23 family metallopeptidase [Glacieibacterium frigidum]|uniref:M23 family metallopeptidase n=2 Tax=Glacieibacterium frigidum TaxID=2593303 RepID=A0A552UAN4_9SPHN|nr:M23 family metallopeptidase [Glacieibacterium frigidum]